MKKRILVIVTMILAVMLAVVSASAEWIQTSNGNPANGRAYPDKDSTLIAYVPYGAEVSIVGPAVNGYVPITLKSGSDMVYVLSRFVKRYKPGPYEPQPDSKKDTSKKKQTTGEVQAGIFAEFKSAVWVTPYDMKTYHKRSSGIINMRFAPNKKATLVDALVSGQTVTVLCEMKTWYLVQCPKDGRIGYIRKDFLQK